MQSSTNCESDLFANSERLKQKYVSIRVIDFPMKGESATTTSFQLSFCWLRTAISQNKTHILQRDPAAEYKHAAKHPKIITLLSYYDVNLTTYTTGFKKECRRMQELQPVHVTTIFFVFTTYLARHWLQCTALFPLEMLFSPPSVSAVSIIVPGLYLVI